MATTTLPATLFVADLFRDDVPGLNYVLTAAFVATALAGLGLIARSLVLGRAGTRSPLR